MLRKLILFILLIPTLLLAQQRLLATITVYAGQTDRNNTPVSVALDHLSVPVDMYRLRLVEHTAAGDAPVACQIEVGTIPRLWWILDGSTPAGVERGYSLVFGDSLARSAPAMTCVTDSLDLTLYQQGKPVLSYRHAILPAPEGVSPLYERSGFIHPLYTPDGDTLTRVQPPDHYHHVGIWNPWTHTLIDGRQVDFWNLGDGLGTVRYAGTLSTTEGPVYTGFRVHQEHVDLGAPGGPRTAINEVWDVRAWNVSTDNNVWLWELTTELSDALDSPIILEAYRYGGGLGYRALEYWNKDNCTVLTSEGADRATADGSRARWCNVGGEMPGGGQAGILFMSHVSNREHPEPMRVWPLDANSGRGDMYFEFCPIRHHPWSLDPESTRVLQYRMLVYEGGLTPEKAELWWQDFANPPQVKINWNHE